MLRNLLTIVLLGLVLYFGLRVAGRMGRDDYPAGYPLPQLTLKPLVATTKPVAAADLQGKVTLINYWATWCGPCIEEFPQLISLTKGYADRDDFQFLSVATGFPTASALQEASVGFLKQRGYDIPLYMDPTDGTRAGLREVPQGVIPLTVLLDRKGEVAKVVVGNSPAELEEVKLLIASLLQEPAK